MKKRRSRSDSTIGSDWVEFGAERIFAVGFTEGGAPFGVTEEEFERSEEPARIRVNWADARDVLGELVRGTGARPGRDAIGRIRFIGAGLSNVVFGASVQLAAGHEDAVVVKLPSRDAPSDRDEQMRAEAALLRHLCLLQLPFQIPRPLGEIQTRVGLAVVQEWMGGMEVDLRAARCPGGRPWEFVARVAAAIHAVDTKPLGDLMRGHATRRDHALEFGSVLNDMDEPEAKDTEAWVREHLPPTTPSCLLHGDLLGQNLRWSWEDDGLAVIDWGEARMGDPAYDLAIVTRGVRKPFATSDGLRRLLEAYNGVAASPLSARDVHLYEVMLAAHLYRDVTRNYGKASAHAESQRGVWRSILKRATHT